MPEFILLKSSLIILFKVHIGLLLDRIIFINIGTPGLRQYLYLIYVHLLGLFNRLYLELRYLYLIYLHLVYLKRGHWLNRFQLLPLLI